MIDRTIKKKNLPKDYRKLAAKRLTHLIHGHGAMAGVNLTEHETRNASL